MNCANTIEARRSEAQRDIEKEREATPRSLDGFAAAIDAIRCDVESKVGPRDLRYIRRVRRVSAFAEIVGRALIHFSLDPLTFGSGVVALWLHQQLEATEIGHSVLHGTYDRIDGAEAFRSSTYAWDTPIDEESWRYAHNIRHHQYTNVAGKDPDIHFGPVRLTGLTPHARAHRIQLAYLVLVIIPNFAFFMSWHFAGLSDVYFGNGRPEKYDFIPGRSLRSVVNVHRVLLRKYIPYYSKEYLLFPLLAGPLFWKVAAGNWLARSITDVYSALTILCGHVGDDVKTFPEGARATGRGEFYKMQVEATNNFEVPLPVSILCGALDRQIEHHLFPRLPPNRLREVAPAVRAACEAHGVEYRTAPWAATLVKMFRHVRRLGRAVAPVSGRPGALSAVRGSASG
jgi:NADPH-dependent stearoyl-CoA 9-desaturase